MEHDKYVEQLYKKIQVRKEQEKEDRTQNAISITLEKRIDNVIKKYLQVLQNPKISQKDQQDAINYMNKTIKILQMHSDHDVIMALTNEAISEKYKQKVMSQ